MSPENLEIEIGFQLRASRLVATVTKLNLNIK